MEQNQPAQPSRRAILKQTLAVSALSVTGLAALSVPTISFAASLSKEERDGMTLMQSLNILNRVTCASGKIARLNMITWHRSATVLRVSILLR